MDDEIDIEEHDVLDNPVLKSIFPDLTKLKQEVLEHNETSIIEIYPKVEELSDNEKSIEENIDEDYYKYNSGPPFRGNKIILGSKPNKDKTKSYCKNTVSLYNTTVSLKNIKPFLDSCKKYCELCLILFPTEEAYKIHGTSYHFYTITHNSEVSKDSESLKTQNKNVSVNTCHKCNSTFTTLSNLNKHIKNIHSKRNQCLNRKTDVPKPPGSCFHCNVVFPNAQSLIEHLYDTLGTNKTNEIRNKGALNNKRIFKDVEHSDSKKIETEQKQDIEDCRKVQKNIKNRDVLFSKESEPYVYMCRLCSYKFQNVKVLERHMFMKHNIKDPGTPKKTLYDPKCKFCSSEYPNPLRHNEHIRKVHRKMLLSQVVKESLNTTILPIQNTKSEEVLPDKTVSIKKTNEIGNKDGRYKQGVVKCVKHSISKKVETEQKQDIVESMNVKKKKSKGDVLFSKASETYVYRCRLCSYRFKDIKVLVRHMLMKHNIKDPATPKKILYDPKCKFCSSEFPNPLRYNDHIGKVHRNMVVSKIYKKCVKPTNVSKLDQELRVDQVNNVETKSVMKVNEEDIPAIHTKENHDECILQSVLFKCDRCDIHFLNSQVAIDHDGHMDILINWKCSLCRRIFKKNDEKDHMMQHSVTFFFNVYDVSESTRSLILYQCPKCSVHFDETKYLQHYHVCETVLFMHVKCKYCGILIDSNLEYFHNSYHRLGNCTSAGLIIVKTDVIHKNSIDQESIKINNKDVTLDHKELRPRKLSKDTLSEDNKLFKVYYCKSCKSFVNEHTILKHKNAKCKDYDDPIVCILCGLIYPRKNTSSHARLHTKKIDLTLQDFEFYDLNSKRLMNPPLPTFPHCSHCGIYFPRKNDKMRHCCGAEGYSSCSTCKLKFSESGYKLHMNYHGLSSSHSKSLTNTSDISDTLSINEETNDNVLIYTCKHCHMSLSNYDLVIEHCQAHLNSHVMKMPEGMCNLCNLVFDAKFHKNHEEIHLNNFDKNKLKTISFDTVGFKTDYKAWIKKVFESLPQEQTQNIIENSIYKDENRIKMQLIQEGYCDVTMYKCDICNCFVDPQSLIKHIGTDCRALRNHTCKVCFIPFVSQAFKLRHEEIHKRPFKGLKSYRIILFNKKDDDPLNSALYTENSFILYKCAKCKGVVNKNEQEEHLCDRKDLKLCSHCSLLIYSKDFNLHLCKHKNVDTFVTKNIKVIVFGENNENESNKNNSEDECPSKRKRYGYEIYRCKRCQMCLSDERSSRKHVCNPIISKSKCPLCGLTWLKCKLKTHYALHNSDSNFVIDNISIIDFDNTNSNLTATSLKNPITEDDSTDVTSYNKVDVLQNRNSDHKLKVTTKLYRCSCGLHFLDYVSVSMHQTKSCYLKHKGNIRQECSKCGLLFQPNVLFSHVVKHHGNREVTYKYDIIDIKKRHEKKI